MAVLWIRRHFVEINSPDILFYFILTLSISDNCFAIVILGIISFPISHSSSACRRFCIFHFCPFELYLQVAKMTLILLCMCCLYSSFLPHLPLRPCLLYIQKSFLVSICHVNIRTALLPPIHPWYPENVYYVHYILSGILVFKSLLHWHTFDNTLWAPHHWQHCQCQCS